MSNTKQEATGRTGGTYTHTKYQRDYLVLSDNVRFKDSVKGWTDAVAYLPLYENDFDFFMRDKESFDEGFVPANPDMHKAFCILVSQIKKKVVDAITKAYHEDGNYWSVINWDKPGYILEGENFSEYEYQLEEVERHGGETMLVLRVYNRENGNETSSYIDTLPVETLVKLYQYMK